MGEEIAGLINMMGGIAAQCYAPRLIKSNYLKSFSKLCSFEITEVIKTIFKDPENSYTKMVLNYMKTPGEEVEALLIELQKKNVRVEVRDTLTPEKNLEIYELIYNNYLKSALYLLYKDAIHTHLNTIKDWIEKEQIILKAVVKKEDPQQEGTKLLELKDYKNAMKKFKEASTIKDANLMANMGNVHFLQGNYKDARDNYIEAIKLKPDEVGYYITLGNIYDKLSLFSDADDAYRKAVNLESEIGEVIYERRLFDFWRDKKITDKQQAHLNNLLNFIKIPPERIEVIERQVKQSLGIVGQKKTPKKIKTSEKMKSNS